MNIRKKLLALLLAASLLPAQGLVLAQSEPEKSNIDGIDTVFLSSFGKVKYGNVSHSAYRSLTEALTALGTTGGRVLFQGSVDWSAEIDFSLSAPLTVEGIGNPASGNVLNISREILELQGDMALRRLVLRMPENGVIHTNGHALIADEGFDSYCQENYVAGGPNLTVYPSPVSVIASPGSTVKLYSGYLKSISADEGSAGNLCYELKNVTAESFVPCPSKMSGNVSVRLAGGNCIKSLLPGEGELDGNFFCAFTYADTIQFPESIGNFSLTGTSYAITDTKTEVPENLFDVTLRLTEGYAEPVFDGTEFLGFSLSDKNGFSTRRIKVNGTSVSSEDGLFQFSERENTVEPEPALSIGARKENAYMAGYTDGTFRPQNSITRAEAITTLSRLITDESQLLAASLTSDYEDVADGAWYEPYIALFEHMGYLDTLSVQNKIEPDAKITRGEFCELIANIYPIFSKKLLFSREFPDIDAAYRYKDSVEKVAFAGIVGGYTDGTFRADHPITRAEAVTMLNRLLGREPSPESDAVFSDVSEHWAKGQISAASGESEKEGVVMWTSRDTDSFGEYMQYRYSLDNTRSRLEKDKELNVAFIGGSVTAGAGASQPNVTSWRGRTVQWFRDTYPNCTIRELNAAIGDSYTKYAVYRMDHDLLRYDYDIVFVEYAINDSSWYSAENDSDTIVYFETLIRRIYEHNPKADIVIVYTIDNKLDRTLPYFSTAAAQEKIAVRYDIPSVNFGRALANYVGDNGYKWEDYFTDYVHPNDIGYLYYASVLSEYLSHALSDDNREPTVKEKVLPSPAASHLWYDLTMLEANEIDLSASKNWALSDDGSYIVPTSPDNELILKTKGTDICIAAPRDDLMEYSVDGGEVQTMKMNRKPQTLAKNLSDGEHTLRIHATDVGKLRIQRLMYNGK